MIGAADLRGMTSVPWRGERRVPHVLESLLFLALMSGPPKFRDRDPFASLAGEIDGAVLFQVAVWAVGGLWVLARIYPAVLRRGVLPAINVAQGVALLFIISLTFSLTDSPGVLLTAYSIGQLTVMLGFLWVFTHRFGAPACLQHMFVSVTVLALITAVAAIIAPDLVGDAARVRGDNIADAAGVAVIGLVLCLSGVPPLRGPMLWGALSLFGTLLAVSRTRSAYAAFLVFLAIGFFHGRRLPVRKLLLPVALVAVSVFVLEALPSTIDYVLRERESIESMSDRIPLWQHLTDVVMREAPLTGLGYYAASRVIATEYNPLLGNAHSVFFEVLLGGGILGAILYLLLCGSLMWLAIRLLWIGSGQPTVLAAVGLFWVALLMGITSPAGLNAGPLGFAFWSSTALLPALLREAARSTPVAEHSLRARWSRLRPTVESPVAISRRAE